MVATSNRSVSTSPRARASGTLPLRAHAFYRRWVGWTVAGEAAGFAVAAIAGALATTQDLARTPEFALLVAAGAIEGALLGAGQATAMRRLQLPSRLLRLWPVVTSAAAALAWSIGLLPSSIPGVPWSSPAMWLVAAVLGAALLLSIPTAQYLLLRTAVTTARRWIWINALAWLVGICWTFLPSPLVSASTPIFALIAIYVVAGLFMATTVAVITGLCWLSWLKHGAVRTVDGVA